MATTPDADLVTHLDANVGALTDGTNLFRGKMRAAGDGCPVDSVFVLSSGGPAPQAYLSGTTVERRYSDVTCYVRSDLGDFEGGQTLARAIRDAAHHADIAGYIDVRALQSEPPYVAERDDEAHVWVVNFQLWHEQ